MSRSITLVYHGNLDNEPFVERTEAYLITDKVVFQRSGEDLVFREAAEIIGGEAHVYDDKPYRYLCFGIMNNNGVELAKKITGEQLVTLTFAEVVASLMR